MAPLSRLAICLFVAATIGSPPAIQNAVIDAVSHLGVKHIDMPLSGQRVWAALQAAG